MISNSKQLGGTLNAVWLVLTAVGAGDACASTATVRNLTGNISLTSRGRRENKRPAKLSRAAVSAADWGWLAFPGNLGFLQIPCLVES